MKDKLNCAAAMIAGAAAMYYLDPEMGRRRALLKDKMVARLPTENPSRPDPNHEA